MQNHKHWYHVDIIFSYMEFTILILTLKKNTTGQSECICVLVHKAFSIIITNKVKSQLEYRPSARFNLNAQ